MIAVDAMGGDFAPEEPCQGAILACRERPHVEIALVGDTAKIKPIIDKAEASIRSRISIIHADEVIYGDDSPSLSIRKKKNSSLVVGFEKLREGEIDGFVSAGNTGAIAAAGVLILGRIPGIDRPALGVMFPALNRPTLLLDVGGTVHCKPENLYQFAHMGQIYMKYLAHVKNPSIKILNIGSELIKGDDVIAGARELIEKNKSLNYQGYTEANELPNGTADVVVCDGFTGNVLIKFGEGLGDLLKGQFKKEFMHHVMPKIGLVFMYSAMKRVLGRFEWEKIGHAPLLGVKGTVIKVHGRSKRNAICYAILGAADFVAADGIGRIKNAITGEDVPRREEAGNGAAEKE